MNYFIPRLRDQGANTRQEELLCLLSGLCDFALLREALFAFRPIHSQLPSLGNMAIHTKPLLRPGGTGQSRL